MRAAAKRENKHTARHAELAKRVCALENREEMYKAALGCQEDLNFNNSGDEGGFYGECLPVINSVHPFSATGNRNDNHY